MGYLSEPLLDSLDGAMQSTGDAGKLLPKMLPNQAKRVTKWAVLTPRVREKAFRINGRGDRI